MKVRRWHGRESGGTWQVQDREAQDEPGLRQEVQESFYKTAKNPVASDSDGESSRWEVDLFNRGDAIRHPSDYAWNMTYLLREAFYYPFEVGGVLVLQVSFFFQLWELVLLVCNMPACKHVRTHINVGYKITFFEYEHEIQYAYYDALLIFKLFHYAWNVYRASINLLHKTIKS